MSWVGDVPLFGNVGLTRRGFFSAIALAPLASPRGFAAVAPQPYISLADFGLSPGDAGKADAESAFRAALTRLPKSGGVISVPPGRWSFARTEGVAIPIGDRANVTIEGHGATLLFRGAARPFAFRNCVSPILRGLTIDWLRPPFSQGEVIAVTSDRRSVDIRIQAAFPVDGSEQVVALQTMEPKTGLTALHGVDAFNAFSQVRLVREQVLRIALTRPLALKPGDFVVLRHQIHLPGLLHFVRCTNLLVEDVALRCGAGMGVVAEGCDGAQLRRMNIAPPPQSANVMTLTHDGAHFAACRGAINLDDCHMEGMGDDGVNVHANYHVVTERIDKRTLKVSAPRSSIYSASSAAPSGDCFQILGPCYDKIVEAVVDSVKTGPDEAILRFRTDLPVGISVGDLTLDAEAQSVAKISNCRFHGNRGRGVLTHVNTVIAGCSFAGQSGPVILLSVEPFFREAPTIENILFRDNDVSDPCRVFGAGAIVVEAKIAGGADDYLKVNRNVAIVENRFADIRGPVVAASSIAGLSITRNRLTNGANRAVVLNYTNAVKIEGNIATPPGEFGVAQLSAPEEPRIKNNERPNQR